MAEMTPQKALEILEMFLHKQCSLERTEFAYSQNEVWEAVKMASEALEKPIQETTEQDKTLTLVFGKDGKARLLNEDYVIYCADEETFEKVKAAVEKQTAKKTLWGGTNNASWRSCPECHSRENKTHKHCSQCGQALDWSDAK